MVRGLLSAMSAASCLCATSHPPAAVSQPAPSTTASSPAPAATPIAVTTKQLAGDWLFEATRGGDPIQFSLHFSATGGVLAGSLTGPDGNARELSKIALHEDKVSWDVEGQGGTLHYEGAVSGTSMKGTVRRSGGRRQGSRGGDSGEGSGDSPPQGGGRGGGMRGGRGHRSGRGGSAAPMTWSAYKSVAPPAGERALPEPTPTPGS